MKKKLTVVIVCILIASVLCTVLAACNGTTEQIITFRDSNAFIMFKGKTIDGKVVEPKLDPYKEGYVFDGWYKTTAYLAADKINYEEVLTEDTDFYAKWNVKVEGEKEGYCVIGGINGETNWSPADIALNWKMEQVDEITYTIDLIIKKGDAFKVKTFYKDWDTKQVNLDSAGLKEVKLAEGVTLPADATTPADLFAKTSNIAPVLIGDNEQYKITLTYTYDNGDTHGAISILINEIVTIPTPEPEPAV